MSATVPIQYLRTFRTAFSCFWKILNEKSTVMHCVASNTLEQFPGSVVTGIYLRKHVKETLRLLYMLV